jgi:hypothetical protein
MSITVKHMIAITSVVTSVGLAALPQGSTAREAHHHYPSQAAHHYSRPDVQDHVAQPVDPAKSNHNYGGPRCDPGRDWNC